MLVVLVMLVMLPQAESCFPRWCWASNNYTAPESKHCVAPILLVLLLPALICGTKYLKLETMNSIIF